LHSNLNILIMQNDQEPKKSETRAKTKTEVATGYNPDSNQSTAVRILRRWISQDPNLLEALTKLGYNKYCHLLTPIQVLTIHDHLGKP